MGYSPYTARAVSYVEKNPGCTKLDLATALRNNCRFNPTKLYRLVNTQIRLGNIVALKGKGNAYALYIPEQIKKDICAKLGLDVSIPDNILQDACIDANIGEN